MITTTATQVLTEERPVSQILLLEDILQSCSWDDDDSISDEGSDEGSADEEHNASSCWSSDHDNDEDEDADAAISRISVMSLDALLTLKKFTAPHHAPPAKQEGKAAPVPAAAIRSQRFHYNKARPAPASRGVARSESLPKRISRPKNIVEIQQETSAQNTRISGIMNIDRARSSTPDAVKPSVHYQKLCEKNGMPVRFVSLKESEDGSFFLPNTPEHKAAFVTELVNAVRNHDLEAIKNFHQSQGYSLDGRSPFTGESLMHVCVRRGTPDILRYMLRDAKVYPRVCCEHGRSPLHDACWSNDARSLEMMTLIIQECPDMLRMLDKRGFSPLDYIPRDHWAQCCAFLDKHQDIILPTPDAPSKKNMKVPCVVEYLEYH